MEKISRTDLSYFKTNAEILEHQKRNNLFRERNPDRNEQAKLCNSVLLGKDPENPVVLYLSGSSTFPRGYMGWPSKPYHDKADSRKIAKSIVDDYQEVPFL